MLGGSAASLSGAANACPALVFPSRCVAVTLSPLQVWLSPPPLYPLPFPLGGYYPFAFPCRRQGGMSPSSLSSPRVSGPLPHSLLQGNSPFPAPFPRVAVLPSPSPISSLFGRPSPLLTPGKLCVVELSFSTSSCERETFCESLLPLYQFSDNFST